MSTQYYFNPDRFDLAQPSPEAILWRYTDLPKLLSLLGRKALYFCRLDRFGDPFEGSLPRALVRAREERYQRSDWGTMSSDDTPVLLTRRRNTIVSCWHVAEAESTAMWSLYARDNLGLAIQSTYERLCTSLPRYDGSEEQAEDLSPTPTVLHVAAGLVEYVDFDDESAALDVLRIAFYKRRSFAHERELRAVSEGIPRLGDPTEETCFPRGGDYVPVDVARLIEALYLAPQAPGWFAEVVNDAIKRYGFAFEVRHSALDRDPVF